MAADPQDGAGSQSQAARPPLYEAALGGNVDEVRRLARGGADPDAVGADNGWTALMLAASQGDASLTRTLLDASADGTLVDERGRTPLHIAAAAGHARVTEQLLAAPDAPLNVKDARGETPLAAAAAAGQAEVVELLLRAAATDVNLVDRDRRTPLHWTALSGGPAVARLLVSDPRTNLGIESQPEGMTAEGLARAVGNEEVATIIAAGNATNPGTNELSPHDDFVARSPERRPPFLESPMIPERPGLREPSGG